MNTEYFIARRLMVDKESSRQLSRAIVRIAVFGISLGLAVMIITVATVTAFKAEVRNKVIGFASHIQILNFDSNISYENQPVHEDKKLEDSVRQIPGVTHLQIFATKPGIIKTKTDIQGVYLKGISNDFDWSFFKKHLKEGNILSIADSSASTEIMISRQLSKMLKVKLGDPLIMYFVQDPPRIRKFRITGIYETGLEEFDKSFALVDIRQIRQLNGWEKDQIGGYEIFINDFSKIEDLAFSVRDQLGYGVKEEGDNLKISTITEKYPQIFDWLGLFDMNVSIIIILMLVVAGINMISGLLVIILERTNMIGILKALGTDNLKIRRLFLYLSGFLILRGLFWGNLIGLSICAVQYFTGLIKLDPAAYFLSQVPIRFEWFYFLLLNVGTLLTVLIILILPSLVISRISPSKTIRFN